MLSTLERKSACSPLAISVLVSDILERCDMGLQRQLGRGPIDATFSLHYYGQPNTLRVQVYLGAEPILSHVLDMTPTPEGYDGELDRLYDAIWDNLEDFLLYLPPSETARQEALRDGLTADMEWAR